MYFSTLPKEKKWIELDVLPLIWFSYKVKVILCKLTSNKNDPNVKQNTSGPAMSVSCDIVLSVDRNGFKTDNVCKVSEKKIEEIILIQFFFFYIKFNRKGAEIFDFVTIKKFNTIFYQHCNVLAILSKFKFNNIQYVHCILCTDYAQKVNTMKNKKTDNWHRPLKI